MCGRVDDPMMQFSVLVEAMKLSVCGLRSEVQRCAMSKAQRRGSLKCTGCCSERCVGVVVHTPGVDWRLDLACSSTDTFTVGEVYPIPVPSYTVLSCGSSFTVTVPGRSVVILSVGPAAGDNAFAGDVVVTGRAARRDTRAQLSSDASQLHVTGLQVRGRRCPKCWT